MAGSMIIGALRVSLGIDTAAFNEGLDGAQQRLSGFGSTMGRTLVFAAAAVTAALGGLSVAFKGAVNDAEHMGALAQSVGLPVEELSRLKYAAELSEVGLESLSTGLRKLSKNMADVSAGSGKAAALAFTAIGVSATNSDGSLRSSDAVLTDVAARFASMKDGAAKTAIAIALFGRSGAELIPMLNAGRDGLQQMKDEADRLGIVIDTKTAAAADRFNDNLSRLGMVQTGIIQQMTAGALPAFERLSQLLVNAATKTDAFRQIGATLGSVMEGVARGLILVWDNLGILVKVAASFMALRFAAALVNVGLVVVRLASAIRTLGLVSVALSTIQKVNHRYLLFLASAFAAAAGTSDEFAAAIKRVGGAIEGMLPKGLSAGFLDWMSKAGLNISALTDDFSKLDTGTMDTSAALGSLDSALAGAAAATKRAGEATKNAKQELEEFNQAATSVYESTRTPLEKYAMDVQGLNAMFIDGALSFETYNRALAQARDGLSSIGDAGQDVGRTLNDSVTSSIDKLIDRTFSWKDALSDLLKNLAKALANSAFQSLGQGFANKTVPGTSGGFFGSLFKGLFGFATGGGFTVGGSGGIDSKLVAFRATPGEMVNIHKPGNDNGAGGMIGGLKVQLINQGTPQEVTSARPTPTGDGLEVYTRDIIKRVGVEYGLGRPRKKLGIA